MVKRAMTARTERVSDEELAAALATLDEMVQEHEQRSDENQNEKKEEEEEDRIFATYTNTRLLRSYW